MIRPDLDSPYGAALIELLKRVETELRGLDKRALPVTMVIAGGAALYLHTSARATEDVDATFSRRILLGQNIEIPYRDADGRAALLYLDRNYNDTLSLMHEDAANDAERVDIKGIDRKVLDLRALAPLDLAVSKLARFSDQDREDILLLATRKLINPKNLRTRAEEALKAYVGNLGAVQNTIDITCKLLETRAQKKKPAGKR